MNAVSLNWYRPGQGQLPRARAGQFGSDGVSQEAIALAVAQDAGQCLGLRGGHEACAGSHWLARRLASMRHEARLISPQLVRPFVAGNKNDFGDA
jgi:transposase